MASGGINLKIKVDISNATVMNRFRPKFRAATKALGDAVLESSTPYVPYDTGATTKSGKVTMDGDTKALITWDTKYSRYIYYGTSMNFQKTHHPKARAQWFEGAKAVDLAAWVKTVDNTLKG